MVFGLTLVSLTTFVIVNFVFADEGTHTYLDNEKVIIWVNKVGPFNNPTETYPYYSKKVPVCDRAAELNVDHKEFHYNRIEGLGSILQGNDIKNSGIPVKFKQSQAKSNLCTMTIDYDQSAALVRSIEEKYWYQMYVDDLPLWGMVGDMLGESENSRELKPHIYTHKSFSFAYNDNRVIEVNLTSEEPELLTLLKRGETQTLTMTYSVTWPSSSKTFKNRFDRYLDFDFFEHQIHWFSLFNSFMMVIFLVGLVSLILMRTLRKDYERISADDETVLEFDNVVDETGWKQIHGDVFRAPKNLPLFAAVIGSGYQVYFSVLFIILAAIFGELYDDRGSVGTVSVMIYAATASIAGVAQSRVFSRYSERNSAQWKLAMVLTGALIPSIISFIMFGLNTIAVIYGSTTALSAGTLFYFLLIWFFAMCLLLVGTLIGRATYMSEDFPCPVRKTFVRPIPSTNEFYMKPWFVSMVGGVLPFGSIFIEMYFIFTIFWNYKF
jgi:transmembrane 9 superfamily protein 3